MSAAYVRFSALILLALALSPGAVCSAQELQAIALPKPKVSGGRPLMDVLSERKSTREFSPRKLPLQVLSDLLWAAGGINRPDGRRTAPSASNRQEIEIYVVLPEGAYVYEPKGHRLEPVAAGDLRAATGLQDYVGSAALNLVYVADLSKFEGAAADVISLAERQIFTPAADTGFIAQNVYLFCASEGLGTVVRGRIDKPALGGKLKLRDSQRVVLAQSVGYPQQRQ